MKTNDYAISIYLDTRRAKQNGKYPVKLRVFTSQPRIQKLYSTPHEFTVDEFKSIWETTKPRKEHKPKRLELQAIENEANQIAGLLPSFTWEAFERQLLGAKSNGELDVTHYYRQAITGYRKNKQIGTAENYEQSLKSLTSFHGKETLPFYTITSQWLKDYERHMVEVKKRSPTTVGIYLRPLRAVFNTAIADKVIAPELYPFGKRNYTIPAPKGVKKAVPKQPLRKLFEETPETPEQKKAKAFWFFSYACNGMNIKDIAYLQYKDISKETITFRRAKTANTNKAQAPVIVYLNDFTRSVIEEYGNPDKKPNQYVFPIIDHTADADTRHRQLKNFIRLINQHFEQFAKSTGIEDNVSTYWARHTFATNAIRSGASMEYVSEALSHSNLNTTRNYFAGFEDEKKKEIAERLMVF